MRAAGPCALAKPEIMEEEADKKRQESSCDVRVFGWRKEEVEIGALGDGGDVVTVAGRVCLACLASSPTVVGESKQEGNE